MQPTVSPEEHDDSELQGNDQLQGNTPLEEEGRQTASHDQEQAPRFRNEAQRGLNDPPVAEPNRPNQVDNQPGGPSGDAKASARSGKQHASQGAAGLSPKPGGGARGKLGGNMSSRAKKRLAVIVVTAVFGALISIAGFLGLLAYKLVHVEQNITQKVDQRLAHSIGTRVGPHLVDIFNNSQKGQAASNTDTGAPIADADANYNIPNLESSMGVTANYDSSGKLIDFTSADGTKMDVSTSSLEDPNSPFMQDFASHEPQIDFFRESIRSRVLDASWGIIRKFLPAQKDKASTDTKTITDELNQEFTAVDENTNGAADGNSSAESNAKQDLKSTVDTAKSNAAAAVGPAGSVLNVCGAEAIAKGINRDMYYIRFAQLVRDSEGVVMPTSGQVMRGDLHPAQLSVFMKFFSGFEKAGGWQVLSGTKGAKLSSDERSRFGATPTGPLASITGSLSSGAPQTICDPINSVVNALNVSITIPGLGTISLPLGVGVIDGAQTALGPEEATLLEGLSSAGLTVAQNSVASTAIGYLSQIAVDAATKPVLAAATATGPAVIDATISGYDNYSNTNARSNGGERLSASQVAQLNSESQQNYAQNAQQKGLAYALFSPSYTNSITNTLLMSAPSSPSSVASSVNGVVASLANPFSHSMLSAIAGFFGGGVPAAKADNAASDKEDPLGWGVPQMGFPDQLLKKYPHIKANEKWVINYLATTPYNGGSPQPLFDSGTPSSSELTGQNDQHADLYHDFVRKCLISSNPDDYLSSDCQGSGPTAPDGSSVYDRFRVYRLDLGVSNMIHSYNNTQDDQHPAGSGSTPTGGGTPPGGVTVPPGTVPFPIQGHVEPPSTWSQDQGVDISTTGGACGKSEPLVALGLGTIIRKGIDGFGPDAPVLKITGGPLAGKFVYYGHSLDRGASPLPAPKVGDTVAAGDVVSYVGCGVVGISTGPHLEIGINSSELIPSNHQTSAEMLSILTQSYKEGHK